MRIVIEPYSPQWTADFSAIKSEIIQALDGIPCISIEHVGSTSVPGMAAKPIIDIDIVVAHSEVHNAVFVCEGIGYKSLGECGIPGRHVLKAPGRKPLRNLYVCAEGCLSLRNHLAVRSTLRRDAALRAKYLEVKMSLAQQKWDNHMAFCIAKSDIVNRILEKSNAFEPHELDEIKRVNGKWYHLTQE